MAPLSSALHRLIPPLASRRQVHGITTRRRPEIDPAGLVSPFFLRHPCVIVTAPRRRSEPRVVPLCLNPRAVLTSAVV